MRILFLLDSVEAPAGANVQLGRRLAAALAARGHSLHLLELWDGQTPPPPVDGCRTHRLAFPDERLMNAALENGRKGGSPLFLRLARLCAHPTAAAAAFRQLALHAPRRTTAARREMERLDAEYDFDAILAVCAPYRAAFALETARTDAKKLLWQMDPYAANRDYAAPGGYAREGALLNAVSASFITPQALPDYADGAPLARWRGKVHPLSFPSLVPPAAPAPHAGRLCLFCGSLYPGLREPGFALDLFAALAGRGSDWQLEMAGGGWEHFAAEAERAETAMGGRLHIPGPVPPDEARARMAGADVLLSLGNAVDNQVPSKIFDYIAAGRPILHLSVTAADPALPYLARYPLALTLSRAQGVTGETVTKLARWLDAVAGRRLDFPAVEALFPEFTPARVAEEFERVVVPLVPE